MSSFLSRAGDGPREKKRRGALNARKRTYVPARHNRSADGEVEDAQVHSRASRAAPVGRGRRKHANWRKSGLFR
jgi:hypothetical protein